jgi:hypothetical protein
MSIEGCLQAFAGYEPAHVLQHPLKYDQSAGLTLSSFYGGTKNSGLLECSQPF